MKKYDSRELTDALVKFGFDPSAVMNRDGTVKAGFSMLLLVIGLSAVLLGALRCIYGTPRID